MADPTDAQRKVFAKMGFAMPDGSYFIRPGHPEDLTNAIKAVGRGADDSHNAIRKHIMTRAKALGQSDKIPDTWNPDGSLKHTGPVENFLSHHGVRGMKWGVRRSGKSGSSPSSHPVSEDAAKAREHADTVRKHGTSALSNKDLQHLVTRQNLLKQHEQLSTSHKTNGQKFVDDLVKQSQDAAKQELVRAGTKAALKGAAWAAAKYATK